MRTVKLSKRTDKRLSAFIESFDDTPDVVINRVLDRLEEIDSRDSAHKGTQTGDLLNDEGELLPESEYWIPILRTLADSGGAERGNRVIAALEGQLGPRLTKRDHDVLSMGEVRWRNRARFARLRMKEKGLISSDSPRGLWEITKQGYEFLREAEES